MQMLRFLLNQAKPYLQSSIRSFISVS